MILKTILIQWWSNFKFIIRFRRIILNALGDFRPDRPTPLVSFKLLPRFTHLTHKQIKISPVICFHTLSSNCHLWTYIFRKLFSFIVIKTKWSHYLMSGWFLLCPDSQKQMGGCHFSSFPCQYYKITLSIILRRKWEDVSLTSEPILYTNDLFYQESNFSDGKEGLRITTNRLANSRKWDFTWFTIFSTLFTPQRSKGITNQCLVADISAIQ